MKRYRLRSFAVLAVLLLATQIAGAERRQVQIASTSDGTQQPCYVIVPDDACQNEPRPLLVSLHSWSGDVEQRNEALEEATIRRGWIYLFPHFRGVNDHPEACGSLLAQQDILDAVAWAREHLPVDTQRIYLTGSSGGGHMTMLMAARHADVWTAASAWVGISDLASWHAMHAGDRYGEMLRKCCGGPPGASDAVDKQYRARSPLTWLDRATTVPLDVAAGVHDGHTGSVPVRHSLDAFNVVARAIGATPVSEAEIQQLSRPNGHLDKPQASDQVEDSTYGRKIYLRRHAGKARVTIFEGGHEGLPEAALSWLEQQRSRPEEGQE